jgi:exodeoxyribonuclease VII large subunit
LSYRGVLARGFALVRDEAGHPLHAAADIGPAARMSIEFADGRVGAIADGSEVAAAPASPQPATREAKPAPPKRAVKPADQGSLF